MRIGSLFSGIGGLELGLERAIPGARVVWQVEKDPYARRVLEKHWPEARRYEDVQEVGAHNLGVVDLICGGFPCQDISVAGAGAGLEGERSGLWFQFARILRELRPRYVVLENVAALRFRGLDQVLGSLAESGYDAVWDCIPAAAVGAPHRRDRWFCVAYSVRGHLLEQSKPIARRKSPFDTTRDGPNGAVAHPNSKGELQQEGPFGKEWRRACNGSRWPAEPSVGRVADGIPYRVDRNRCLGNAVVPQVAEVVGRVVAELERLR